MFFKEVLFRRGIFIFFKFYLVEVYNDKQPVKKKQKYKMKYLKVWIEEKHLEI